MVDKVMGELRKIHGKDLTFNEGETYYLFLKDGLYSVCVNEETMTLEVNV